MRDYAAYEDERAEELIDGKVVMLAPASMNHTLVAGNIYGIFWNYLQDKRCVPISDGSFVFLTDEDHFVPDMMVVCDPDKIRPDGVHGAPDLVVEVLSRSTARNDRTHKKDVYARCGVQEYWLVNPSDRSIEVYHNTGTEFVLDDIYAQPEAWELERMSEKERAGVKTRFQCSLFKDLDIPLDVVFRHTF